MTRGEKIAQMRREAGRQWTQERLAKELSRLGANVSRVWVAHLETDRIKKPLLSSEVGALAAFFGKPASFFNDDSEAPSGIDASSYAAVSAFAPVLGTVPADRFGFSLDAIPEEQIPNPYGSKKVFALRVIGNCMEPTFRDGEYIYFSTSQPVADGKIVLARLDGEHTLKRYFKRADGIELRPDNPKYKTKVYTTNKLEIIAVAVGRYGKL